MILIIDNFDSFIHILARYVRELGYETNIIRNDCDAEFIAALPKARGLIVSPGPNAPGAGGHIYGGYSTSALIATDLGNLPGTSMPR